MIIRELRPLHENKELVEAMVNHISRNENKVCSVCKLQVMGHAPESKWLGYAKHEFTPMPATAEMIAEAKRRTSQAYKNRCKLNMCGAYCVSTHQS